MAQFQLQHHAGISNPAVAVGAVYVPSTSLYVGDLDLGVTEALLFNVFSQIGQVVSVRVCRDVTTRRSLGYAYVNFSDPVDAARAIEVYNFTPLNGKTIRIMYSNRNPSLRKSGAGNIFIKNLQKSIGNKDLHDIFSAFGNILSCKIAIDASGLSKGYGFVQFEQEEAAQNAIQKLNGMLLDHKKVFIGPFIPKQEREGAASICKSTVVTEDTLQEIFGEYGKAQKKSEREQELKERFAQSKHKGTETFQGVNLYIKNLDDSIGDDSLRELFAGFGTITSCKVMCDNYGKSKGFGFVAFQSQEDASRALSEMNGKVVSRKPLYVAVAQHKEDRRAMLQAQFSQIRPAAMQPSIAPNVPLYPPITPGLRQPVFYGQPPLALVPQAQLSQIRPTAMQASIAPHVPLYPPGTPGLGQPLFYGLPPPSLVPQPGFAFQQQLVPGMGPGGVAFPNFCMPMVQHGQQVQGRPGGRHGPSGPVYQTQQPPVPMIQQQMISRARPPYRYPPGRNIQGMFSLPYGMSSMPERDAGISQPIPIGDLTSALTNATPAQQRSMLGESLYPLVDRLEHDHAAKVTGMLLEMNQTEVLHLLESPEALSAKVAEAMEVLRNNAQQQQQQQQQPPLPPVERLDALSLNNVV